MTTTPTPPAPPRLRETDAAIHAMQAAMHVLFVVLLGVGLIRALSGPANPVPIVTLTVAFVAIYATGLLIERRSIKAEDQPHTPQDRADRLGLLWIVALILGWCALLVAAGDFVWLAFALYFLILHVAARPFSFALVGVVLSASLVSLLTAGDRRPGVVIGPVMGMLVALGISWVYAQLRAENEARRRLVAELTASRDDLLAAQEELARTQHEAGALAERTRLARDIHDTLAQSFSSILLLSRAGLTKTPADSLLGQIEATAASGLTDARGVVHALAPAELDAPLAQALTRLADRLEEQTGIATHVTTDGAPRPLSTTLDVALLRVTQSALANVRLHSRATRAGITLSYEPADVRLEIIDDGIGFTTRDVETAPQRGSGFGIAAMRSRLAELGGTLDIESAPGEGTALIVTLPTAATPAPSPEPQDTPEAS